MRLTVLAAAVGSAVAFVGFAGAANASATIDLIWADTGTNWIGDPTTSIEVLVSQSITLNVILTAGPNGSAGATVSVDYSAALDKLAVLGYANTPSVGDDSPLPIGFGSPIDTGSRIENINSGALPAAGIGTGLAAGQSHQLGTVTFLKTAALILGIFEIQSDANSRGDGVLDLDFVDITSTTTFNRAFLFNLDVHEPPDFDGDGVEDTLDNCAEAANPAQDDTDFDDCGNLCDGDYDDDGFVGILDFGLFSAAYLTQDEEKIHRDGQVVGGTVGFLDFGFFSGAYLTVPGPSGTTAGTVACPL